MNDSNSKLGNYDAEVVVLADSEFARTQPFQMIFCGSEDPGRAHLLKAVTPKVFANKIKIRAKELLAEGKKDRVVDRLNSQNAVYLRQLIAEYGKEVVEILMEGKLKVAFLIDSAGGSMDISDDYMRMADWAEDHGGFSESYVTGLAGSAAFELMRAAENVYALRKSSLMWHHGTDEETGELVDEQERDEDKSQLIVYLQQGRDYPGEVLVKRAVKVFEDVSNLDSTVFFSGSEMAEAKLVDHAFKRVRNMKGFFDRRYVLSENLRVEEFWSISEMILNPLHNKDCWHSVDFETAREKETIKQRSKNKLVY